MTPHDMSEPLDVDNADLSNSRFQNVRLAACAFTDVDLSRSKLTNVSLRDTVFANVDLSGVAIRDAELTGMTIDGIAVPELLRAHRALGSGGPDSAADALAVTAIKAFVPAKDFALSKRFYRDIGFAMGSEGGGVAYFALGQASFLLQDFYNEAAASNFMMHLLVADVDAWWSKIERGGVVETYRVRSWPIQLQPWRMRDFCLTDPSGVLWRIGQNVA